jgi:hypothetical protein
LGQYADDILYPESKKPFALNTCIHLITVSGAQPSGFVRQ